MAGGIKYFTSGLVICDYVSEKIASGQPADACGIKYFARGLVKSVNVSEKIASGQETDVSGLHQMRVLGIEFKFAPPHHDKSAPLSSETTFIYKYGWNIFQVNYDYAAQRVVVYKRSFRFHLGRFFAQYPERVDEQSKDT